MLLWIRRVFSTRSAVYAGANWLDKDCIQLARMLEKKRLVSKCVVSAHPLLCISSGLSTVALLENRFFAGKRAWHGRPMAESLLPGTLRVLIGASRACLRACASRQAGMPVVALANTVSGKVEQVWQTVWQTDPCLVHPGDVCRLDFAYRSAFAVADRRDFAISCKTVHQQRTRQRVQHFAPWFSLFPARCALHLLNK